MVRVTAKALVTLASEPSRSPNLDSSSGQNVSASRSVSQRRVSGRSRTWTSERRLAAV